MVRAPLPRVSRDEDDDECHHQDPERLLFHQQQSHARTRASTSDAALPGSTGLAGASSAGRYARLPRTSTHHPGQHHHGQPSRHVDERSVPDAYSIATTPQDQTTGVMGIAVGIPTSAWCATASTRRQWQGSHDIQCPRQSRTERNNPAAAMQPMREFGNPAYAAASKSALGFIMNDRNQASARFDRTYNGYPTSIASSRESRSRRASPRIAAARADVLRPSYDLQDEFEEKYPHLDGYSTTPSQVHYSDATSAASIAQYRDTNTPSQRLQVERTPPLVPPLANLQPKPSIAVAVKARPRVRAAAPSGMNKEKRRARECKIDGCPNYIINRGLCFRHGSVYVTQGGKKCSEDGCASSAKHAGKCWKHGGSVKCLVETCTRKGKTRGFCWSHGGGTKCSDASCPKVAVSNGFCWAHGGGKRCSYEGCSKAACKRMHNYCVDHYEFLKDGDVTLEV